jgi:hypothetical protein
MKHLAPTQSGNQNEPQQPLTPPAAIQQFTLLCGNDNFTQWFYQDIMMRCRI